MLLRLASVSIHRFVRSQPASYIFLCLPYSVFIIHRLSYQACECTTRLPRPQVTRPMLQPTHKRRIQKQTRTHALHIKSTEHTCTTGHFIENINTMHQLHPCMYVYLFRRQTLNEKICTQYIYNTYTTYPQDARLTCNFREDTKMGHKLSSVDYCISSQW